MSKCGLIKGISEANAFGAAKRGEIKSLDSLNINY